MRTKQRKTKKNWQRKSDGERERKGESWKKIGSEMNEEKWKKRNTDLREQRENKMQQIWTYTLLDLVEQWK